jgi:hypothetical protein
MPKFEIPRVVRRNNKNLKVTENLLKILSRMLYHDVCTLCVEFDHDGAYFSKRQFKNNSWDSVRF